MTSHTTEGFWKRYARLPEDIRRQARQAYRFFVQDPYHPSLHFKRIHSSKLIYSVRITLDYRAVGTRDRDEIVWFWIGPHAEYNRLIGSLR